jgi:NAD+ synthase (glutamine-hydrolysing)
MRDGFVKVASATPKIRVADVEYNTGVISGIMAEAAQFGAKLLVLPELCVTGYTCGDLFLQKTLLDGAENALLQLAAASAGTDMLTFVGLPLADSGRLYNCGAALWNGRILGIVPKANIPNYSEFYERRYFTGGQSCPRQITVGGTAAPFGTQLLFANQTVPELIVAAEICEDLWVPNPPSVGHAIHGATAIVNLSASDETVTKDEYRRTLVSGQSARLVCGYIYTDAGAGESTQDLVYTGHDLICENGAILAEHNSCADIIYSELDVQRIDMERRRMGTFFAGSDGYQVIPWHCADTETALTRSIERTPFVPIDSTLRTQRCEKILTLQSLGLKQRMEHTGAKKAVVGVSGGLDSTLALIVCARVMDMLGRPRTDITAVTMPCFGTTKRTRGNAELLAEKLGAELITVDIAASVHQHFLDIGHSAEDYNVVFENAQARERTQVLMDIANGCGGLVIGTGDLSELALGWATYNGDHMSMYGVNAGVPKTLVRHLVQYTADTCGDADLSEVLRSILATPVSPELLPAENGEISQKTEDLVGPYELHDFFLYYAIRWGMPPGKVFRLALYAFADGYDRETILRWLKNFYRRFFAQQFKRSCLPDGPKVGTLTLSPRGDWRMPSDAVASLWLNQLEALE